MKRNSKKEENQPNAKMIKKRRIAIISTIIIGLALTVLIALSSVRLKLQKYDEEMLGSIHAVMDQHERIQAMNDYYDTDMSVIGETLADYIAFYFKDNGYSSTTRSELTELLGQYGYIYFFHGSTYPDTKSTDGYVLSDARLQYFLEDEETYELITEGIYSFAHWNFASSQISGNDYAIFLWSNESIFSNPSIMSAYSADREEYLYAVDNSTDLILDSSESERVQQYISDYMVLDNLYEIAGHRVGVVDTTDGKAWTAVCNELEDCTLVAYVPISEMAYEIFLTASVSVILSWAGLIMVLLYALRFLREESGDDTEYVHLFKNKYADGRLLSHTAGVSIFGIVMILLATIYFQTLINYSAQDTDSIKNLKAFEKFLEIDRDNATAMSESFDESCGILCRLLSSYYMKHPDKLSKENLLEMNSFLSDAQFGITIFDAAGTVEYDCMGNEGYTVSRDDTVGHYGQGSKLWDIISGQLDYFGYYNLADRYYYAACKRQDKPGIVLVRFSYDNVLDVIDVMSSEESLKTADFGLASKGLIENFNPETIMWIEGEGDEINIIPNTLSEEVKRNGFSGVTKINGKRYFTNVRTNNEYTLISAARLSKLYGLYNIGSIWYFLIAFVLQEIILLLLCLKTMDVAPENLVDLRNNSVLTETLDHQMMDSKFRKTLAQMALLTGIVVILQLAINEICDSNPLVTYLISAQWPKGVNLFSVTMIIIVSMGGLIGGWLLEALLIFFTKSMGPRGLTIGRMVSSLIRFMVLVVILGLSIVYIGANPGTLLAGAGIAGGLIAFCAQTTVNDMLSGFLIVFEGLFNIGDWITVDEFRGQVSEIGIRTTKLRRGDTYRIYNNSELRKFTLMEECDRGAVVEIDVAYKEDATKVIKLIEDSRDRYRREIPQITKGPNVLGIIALGNSGITVKIWATADVSKVMYVEREIRRVTKHIFDENKIEIPYTQVTLHEAIEESQFNG